jgi:hypothetical protein
MAVATLTALHDTAIKKSTEQSSKLPDGIKVWDYFLLGLSQIS